MVEVMASTNSSSSSLTAQSTESKNLNHEDKINAGSGSPVHTTPSLEDLMLMENSDDSDAIEESWMNFASVEAVKENAENPIVINTSSSNDTTSFIDITSSLSDVEIEPPGHGSTQDSIILTSSSSDITSSIFTISSSYTGNTSSLISLSSSSTTSEIAIGLHITPPKNENKDEASSSRPKNLTKKRPIGDNTSSPPTNTHPKARKLTDSPCKKNAK